MNNIKLTFTNPWFFLLLIPTIGLALLPYFRLNKKHRRNQSRVISMIIHHLLMLALILPLTGFKVVQDNVNLRNKVILAIDVSDSTKDIFDIVDEKVAGIIQEADEKTELGLLLFGENQYYLSPLSKNHAATLNQYQNKEYSLEQSGSNLESALEFAIDQFEDAGGRIILITDGLQTDGSVLAAAQKSAIKNVRIDVLYVPIRQYLEEVQISDVKLPDYVEAGQNTSIDVVIDSRIAKNILIKVYVNDEIINGDAGSNILVNARNETFSFTYNFYRAGLNEIKVIIEDYDDKIQENNQYYAYVYLEGSSKKVLIIDGSGSEANNLYNLLKNEYYVDVISLSTLESNLEIIKTYETLILMNVANSDLPVGFESKLTYYVETLGGSLLTVGGDKAYRKDDMEDTVYERLLPVYASTAAKSMAVMLVIDSSGSMITHDSDKFELAKLGAEYSVLALSDSDYVGVITFDSTPQLIQSPVPVSQKSEVIDKIRALETRTGTKYRDALQLAKQQLDGFPGNENFNKHVIFLTDGQPTDEGYSEVLSQYGNISVTTIAIGSDHGINPGLLQSMVRIVDGRGNFYEVSNEYDLPEIMEQETLSVASQYSNEETFEPEIFTRIAPVAEFVSLPTLEGYYGTRIKEGATLVLSKDSDPVYATWKYGKGQVSSLMTDLNGTWSSNFLTDSRGIKLLQNLIADMLPKTKVNAADTLVKFKKMNFLTEVAVTTFLDSNTKVYIDVKNPNNQVNGLETLQQTSSTLTAVFESIKPGIYEVTITKTNLDGEIIDTYITYFARSYSSEYNNFFNEPAVFNEMNQITEITEGSLIYETNNIFSIEMQTITKTIDPTNGLLITALILFLLDIVARKFKIKWPKKSKNKVNNPI